MPLIIFFSIFSRFFNKRRGIGIGPEPLINNVFHKRALEKYNFDVETFSVRSYYITNKFDHIFEFPLCSYYSFFRSLFLYECLYMYFNGCLIFKNSIFENLEPYLFKIAGGKSSNGEKDILDIEFPKDIHKKTPIYIGSNYEINLLNDLQ